MRRVHCQQDYNRPADELWQILRRFADPWHPVIDRMEQDGPLRRFWVDGTEYVERLTYLSDSDRALRYSHLSGIEGAQRYDAQICIQGQTVHWTAEIEAAPGYVADIAAGTRVIFKQGLAALQDLPAPPRHTAPASPRAEVETHLVLGPAPLAVTASTAQSGLLVLFLHGIGGNRGNWRDQMDAVPPYARAAAMDLRGYGDSALGPDQTTIDDHCADIDRVAQALGAERLILVGLSFGAWIATSYALRQSLAGLVVSGGCTGMSEATEATRQAFRAARLGPLEAGQSPGDMADGVLQAIAGPHISTSARAELQASMQAIPSETYRDAVTCFTHPPERFDFQALNCPVLLMTGAHDRLAPPAEIRGVAQRMWQDAPIPNVRFEEIAGAGHVCNLEAPERYNETLVEFLQALAG